MAYAQEAKLTQNGIARLDDLTSGCHSILTQIMSNVSEMQSRLYNPRPSPVADSPSPPNPGTLEGTLQSLHERLRQLENMSAVLLNG